ncbi:hypothetical protein [Olivibacter domesticus]|uniref:SprT-like family protein n=1 Tax=Olivibacter domesticus TaxID=407022 RepID=A0A1H7IJE5_OLID1|nr:hypothetical protein [Olivibacter domesticus]SEK62528.1 hypothetical protein SAMN05661044_00724 [Olivibacter domesticus]
MNKRVVFLLLIGICLFPYCRKTDQIRKPEEVTGGQQQVISADQAKKWFENRMESAGNQRRARSYIGVPSWGRSYSLSNQGENGILKVAIENYPIRFGYRDILFQLQPDGQVHSTILEVRVDSTYLTGKITAESGTHGIRHYIQNSDFTGDIYYFEPLSNELLKGWRYEKGAVKYRLVPKVASGARMAGGIDNEESNDDGGGDNGGLPDGWTGNNDDGYNLPPVDVYPEPTEPDPGPDVPVEEPYNPPSYPVGGGGNGSGGGGGPIDSPQEGDYENGDQTDSEVTDEFSNPCFSAVLSRINNGQLNNFISQVLTGMFGTSELFLVRFYDEPLPNYLDGDTRAQRNPDGSYTIQIALNSDVLAGAAQEYIAATIMHEVVHAYMDVRGNPLKDQNYLQHMEMAAFYVSKMQHGLMETFPGITADPAEALAWGGLRESLSWQSMVGSSPTKANQIVNTNSQYRTGGAGTHCN